MCGLSSPLLGRLLASESGDGGELGSVLDTLARIDDLITSPDQAINVMDFEPVARKTLPPAHFAYLQTGVDDDATVRANREGFSKFQIRSRRLVDVRTIDTSVELFGTRWDNPIVIAPTGSQKAFHPEGEIATARAARAKGHLQILSTVTTSSVEDVIAARGAPIWYQLYATDDWNLTRAMIKRAESAGCPVLVLTVDLQDDSNRETLERGRRQDSRQCEMCHPTGPNAGLQRKPMFSGFDLSKMTSYHPPDITWDFLKRLKDASSMRLVIKGLVTREDTELAIQHGADGVIVSNHGGRAEDTLRSTIECLPEVVGAAAGKIPVLVDGGFRRGTDIFKALALGADAICIGRPYLWGLGAFGQPGIEAVLQILRRELHTIMRQAGTTTTNAITPAYVVDRSR